MNRRRPAAAPPRLRRPAAAVPVDRGGDQRTVVEKFLAGEWVRGCELPPGTMKKGNLLIVSEALYYGNKISIAIEVDKEEIDNGEGEVIGILVGTKSEDLLKLATAAPPFGMRLHLCQRECQQLRVNPNLVHVEMLKLDRGGEKTWEENLRISPEMEAVLKDQEEWKGRNQVKEKEKEAVSSSSTKERKKKKKKKKKEKKTREAATDAKGLGEPESPGKKRRRTQKLGGKSIAKKDLVDIYGGTGLDPDPRLRRKLLRKVKKQLRKGKVSSAARHLRARRSPRRASHSWRTAARFTGLLLKPLVF